MATEQLRALGSRRVWVLGVLALGVVFAPTLAQSQEPRVWTEAEREDLRRNIAADRPDWDSPIDEIAMDVILDRARNLFFDDVPWVQDRQHLVFRVVDELRVGPLATIRPRAGTHLLRSPESDAIWSSGIFAAAVDVDLAVPAMGLARGKNYIWVDGPDIDDLRAYIVHDVPRGRDLMVSVCSVRHMQHITQSDLSHALWVHKEDQEAGVFQAAMRPHYECRDGCCDVDRCTQTLHRGASLR